MFFLSPARISAVQHKAFNREELSQKLEATFLPHEIEQALPLIEEIYELKQQKKAVILGHNYMTPDVFHGVSDFVGDSLFLARQAAKSQADIILFNGVHFMAETASILNPERLVLIADLKAGCSLAESITGADVRQLKEQYPDAPVVSYINCSAEVKAETDICCTSANALDIVESLRAERVIFLPDEYLAQNVKKQSTKEIISWEKGKCMVHEQYEAEDLVAHRSQFSDLVVIAHPECSPEVTQAADFSGSTSQMSRFIRESKRKNVLLLTECSMADNLRAEFPEHNFISSCHTCPHMKRITLEGVRDALLYERYEVKVPEELRLPAKQALEAMLALPDLRNGLKKQP